MDCQKDDSLPKVPLTIRDSDGYDLSLPRLAESLATQICYSPSQIRACQAVEIDPFTLNITASVRPYMPLHSVDVESNTSSGGAKECEQVVQLTESLELGISRPIVPVEKDVSPKTCQKIYDDEVKCLRRLHFRGKTAVDVGVGRNAGNFKMEVRERRPQERKVEGGRKANHTHYNFWKDL